MKITDRIDGVTKIGGGYLRADPPAPRSVKIELTGSVVDGGSTRT